MSHRIDTTLFKKSSCGTDVDASPEDLVVKLQYSKVSWVFITFFGTTRLPYQIDFYCKKTGELFESVTDKKRIEHFMLYRRE